MSNPEAAPAADPIFRFERNPTQQFVSLDRDGNVRTYSRECTASREFVLVRVPTDADTGENILTALDEEQRRFVVHNLTPREVIYA